MSKHKKNKGASKPKIDIHDLEPDKDPKAGDYTRIPTMMTKLMQAVHDMKKAIINNFRA
jgi:hypothetical protein